MVNQIRLTGLAFFLFGVSLGVDQAETELILNFSTMAGILNIILTGIAIFIIFMSLLLIAVPARFEDQIRTTNQGTALIWICTIIFALIIFIK